MTLGDRLRWAQAFMLQARLDLDLARSLNDIVRDRASGRQLGSRPELYLPAIYAYCQQSIEKSLKAWLWYSTGTIPKKHNPLDRLLGSRQMQSANRPQHLDLLDRLRRSVGQILDMAPGAGLDRPSLEELLAQPNTEYPFRRSAGDIRLPCQEIGSIDVLEALRVAKRLVISIEKSLGVAGLAPISSDSL